MAINDSQFFLSEDCISEKLPVIKHRWLCVKAIPYLPNPFARAGYDTRLIFKRSLIGLNSEFSFSCTSCLTKAEEISLTYYLPLAGGRIIGFIPFPRVLVLCEMQSVASRIWTRVTVSISYDDNHYTGRRRASILLCLGYSIFDPHVLYQRYWAVCG